MAQNEEKKVTPVTPATPAKYLTFDGIEKIDSYTAVVEKVSFTPLRSKMKDTGRDVHYVSGTATIDGEEVRFKLNEKHSKLFSYFLRKMGLVERDSAEIYRPEREDDDE